MHAYTSHTIIANIAICILEALINCISILFCYMYVYALAIVLVSDCHGKDTVDDFMQCVSEAFYISHMIQKELGSQ